MTDYSYKDYQPYYVKPLPKPGYFTLREIKNMAVPGWPQSIEGLRKKRSGKVGPAAAAGRQRGEPTNIAPGCPISRNPNPIRVRGKQ